MWTSLWFFISNDVWQMVSFAGLALWHLLPAFLFSMFLGVTLTRLQLDGLIGRAFSKRPSIAIVLGTVVGALEPFCACSIVPIVTGLLMGGVPLAGIMAFWVASPTIDPEIFTMTVSILGWDLAVGRLVAVTVLSLGMGYLTALVMRLGWIRGDLVRPSARVASASSCCGTDEAVPATADAGAMGLSVMHASRDMAQPGMSSREASPMVFDLPHAAAFSLSVLPVAACCAAAAEALPTGLAMQSGEDAQEAWWRSLWRDVCALNWPRVLREVGLQSLLMSRWLVAAFMLEKALMMYLPAHTIASLVGPDNPFAVPLGALLGVFLFFNNEQALPIIAGLHQQGMQGGAVIAFLLAGPVTTVPAMVAIWSVVKPRVFFLHAGVGFLGAILLGYMANGFLR